MLEDVVLVGAGRGAAPRLERHERRIRGAPDAQEVKAGEVFCDVESVKAVSDVYSPVSGVIEEVNDALTDDPALVNNDCYGAWFIKVKDVNGEDELLDAAAYEEFCKSEA